MNRSTDNRAIIAQNIDNDPVGSQLTGAARERAIDFGAQIWKGQMGNGHAAEIGIKHVTGASTGASIHSSENRATIAANIDRDPVGSRLTGAAREQAITFGAEIFKGQMGNGQATEIAIKHVIDSAGIFKSK